MIIDNEKTSYLVKAYILKAITLEDYNLRNTPYNLFSTFVKEYGYNIKSMGEQKAFTEWLKGIPNSFNVDVFYSNVNQILDTVFETEVDKDNNVNFELYLKLIYINLKQLLN